MNRPAEVASLLRAAVSPPSADKCLLLVPEGGAGTVRVLDHLEVKIGHRAGVGQVPGETGDAANAPWSCVVVSGCRVRGQGQDQEDERTLLFEQYVELDVVKTPATSGEGTK